jgi:hypothetical protein
MDSDNDGLTDGEEVHGMTPTDPNDADSDDDGLNDAQERDKGTNPNSADTDSDTVGDSTDNCPIDANPGQENTYGDARGDACEPSDDPDGDGLSNNDEAELGTDPNNPDTDGDTFSDGVEVSAGTDPTDPSSHP